MATSKYNRINPPQILIVATNPTQNITTPIITYDKRKTLREFHDIFLHNITISQFKRNLISTITGNKRKKNMYEKMEEMDKIQ